MNIRVSLLLLLAANLLTFLCSAQHLTVTESKQQPIGSTVSVRGVVINGSELGKVRFLQDHTGGIAVFAGSGSVADFSQNVKRGDLIEVIGTLSESNGLTEINPVTSYNIFSSNTKLPEPKDITSEEFSEQFEGQLVRVQCATFVDQGNFYADSYGFTSTVGLQSSLYVNDGNPLYDATIPAQTVSITGVLSQYNDYQILPRGVSDIKVYSCFHFNALPSTDTRQEKFISIKWKTNKSSSGVIYLSDQPNDIGKVYNKSSSSKIEHGMEIEGLKEGKVYYMRVMSVNGQDTIYSPVITFALKSTSTGYIEKASDENDEHKLPEKQDKKTFKSTYLITEGLRRRYMI